MLRGQGELKHIRLLDWQEENDLFIRLLLNSLKQGGPSFIFKKLMLDFLQRVIQIERLPLEAIVIPAPPSFLSHFQDHAFCLAAAFSQLSGLQLVRPPFYFSSSIEGKSQKNKTKRDRRKIQLQVKNNNFITRDKKIIFIDDVLTTGATARAAYHALNKPKDFTIFTLAWRSYFSK